LLENRQPHDVRHTRRRAGRADRNGRARDTVRPRLRFRLLPAPAQLVAENAGSGRDRSAWPSRKWNDTERSLIDTRLSGIVAAIVGLAEAKRAKEEDEGRRRRAYEEALAQYEAQVRARNEERRNLRALFRDVSRLQRANRLREFIAAVEDRARQGGELTPETKQWIE